MTNTVTALITKTGRRGKGCKNGGGNGGWTESWASREETNRDKPYHRSSDSEMRGITNHAIEFYNLLADYV